MTDIIDPNDPQGTIQRCAELEESLASVRKAIAGQHGLPLYPMPPSSAVQPMVNPIKALSSLRVPPPSSPPPFAPPTMAPPIAPDTGPLELDLPWERPGDLDSVMDNMSGWREMILRPGMAHAMLYVILPVIQRAAEYGDKETLVADLQAWSDLTISERVALIELFVWLESEMVHPESSIPEVLRSNMERVQEGYESQAP